MEPVLDRALEALPEAIARRLRELATTRGACAVIGAEEAAGWARSLGVGVSRLLPRLVGWAASYGGVPVSRYRVGAIAQGLSGALYAGANLEFAGLPLSCSVHAEQSATVNAWVHGERGLRALAVSAAPCGYCRQFLYELAGAERLEILVPGEPATLLPALLPGAFGPRDLGIEGGLMQPQDHALALAPNAGDATGATAPRADNATLAAALGAASASYAPYAKTYAGVALRTADGALYDGRYAENAAFNPSLAPMQAALAHALLCGRAYGDITGATLVETAGAIGLRAESAAVLAAVSPVTLDYARAISLG
jgi:cytidine deaminase